MEEYSKDGTIPNPREKANCFSVAIFLYTIPLFLRGYKKDFTESVYETLPEYKTSNLGKRAKKLWKLEVQYANVSGRKPSLKKVLIKMFGWDYVKICIAVGIADIILKPGTSIMLGRYLSCYEPTTNLTNNKNDLYTNSIGFLGFYFLNVLIWSPHLMMAHNLTLKMRIACSYLIYNKILKLNKSVQRNVTPGLIINLLSNDLNHFTTFGICSTHVIVGPIQAVVVIYLTYLEIGMSTFIGVAVLMVFTPFFFLLGKILVKHRTKTSIKTDERIRLVNEIIKGILVIKMYAWEKYFTKYITEIRKLELKSIERSLYIKGLYNYQQLVLAIMTFTVIVGSVPINDVIKARSVFVVIILYSLLAHKMVFHFLQGLGNLGEMNVVLDRMLTFLLTEEKKTQSTTGNHGTLSITDGSAEWNTSFQIKELNLCVEPSSVTAIIGPVGSGKSSLFQLILGELPLNSGEMCIGGNISYASQEPWIFPGTICQNILFGNNMNQNRYDIVVDICTLKHDLTLFPNGDKTIVGEYGASLSGGQKTRINLARAIYREADIYLLDDPFSAVDIQVGKQIFEKCVQGFLKGKTVLLVTHQLQYLKHTDRIVVLENGKIIKKGSTNEKLYFSDFLKTDNNSSNRDIANVVELEQYNVHQTENKNLEENTRKKKFNSWEAYKCYYLSSRSCFLMISVILSFLAAQVSIRGSFYLLSYWLSLERPQSSENYFPLRSMFIYAYSTIIIVSNVLILLRTLVFVKFSVASSKYMHNDMFNSVLNATHRFFNLNSSGRILNRFSKDVGVIDEVLPNNHMTALDNFSNICGVLGIVCFVNPWFLLPTALLISSTYYARKFYLVTSLKLMQLESRLRSPMYGHVNSSLQGLTTIRACNVEHTLKYEFSNHQDKHSSVLHLVFATSRAFAYWCDLLSFLYVMTLVVYFIFNDEISPAYIGLTLTQAYQLTGQIQYCLRQLSDVDNAMVSVNRIREYAVLKQEQHINNLLSEELPLSWPDKGEITFVNVSMKYGPLNPYVLKELNFTIHPSEKIGIVGRTGAGKSSIISALFQLNEIEGTIRIDDIDIKTINIHYLRKSMAIIAQDPILFSSTIRRNLDPEDEFDDEALWRALESVKLQKLLKDLHLGLDSEIIAGGSNFSLGQRQLFCLARAIVKNSKIIILDEATANVDLETDYIIQETIREKFCNHTVITVAHRLHTVMDSDKVLVMDSGKVVEFEHPYLLLRDENGYLYNLLQQTEKVMADTLCDIAKQSYDAKISSQKFH